MLIAAIWTGSYHGLTGRVLKKAARAENDDRHKTSDGAEENVEDRIDQNLAGITEIVMRETSNEPKTG